MNYKEALEKFRSRYARVKEVAEAKMAVGIAAVEVTATAGGFAYLRGRYPTEDEDGNSTDDLTVMGLPLNLLTGISLHALGLVGAAGKYAEHAHNIGSGALADYASANLFSMGKKNREEAEKEESAAPAVSGMPYPNALPSPAPFSPYMAAQQAPMYHY